MIYGIILSKNIDKIYDHALYFPYMYDDALQAAGLDSDEIAIFQALLHLGEASAAAIIAKTGLKRGNAYNKLYSLVEKGLTEKYEKGKIAYFRLTHPSQLKTYIEEREKALATAKTQMEAVLPGLVADYNLAINKPGVYAFEGKEGLIKVYEELLATAAPQDSIEDKGEMVALLGDYTKQFSRNRIKRNIFNRVIAPSNNPINPTSPEELRETRTIPTAKFPFAMDIKIAGTKVSLVTFSKKEPTGILIENSEIAENFRTLFNYLWESLARATPTIRSTSASV